jgi:hypothetical protein
MPRQTDPMLTILLNIIVLHRAELIGTHYSDVARRKSRGHPWHKALRYQARTLSPVPQQLGNRLDELARSNGQSVGEPHNIDQADVALTALHAAHVVPMEVG